MHGCSVQGSNSIELRSAARANILPGASNSNVRVATVLVGRLRLGHGEPHPVSLSSSRPLLNMLRTFFTAGGGPLDFPLGSICTGSCSKIIQQHVAG